MGSGSSRVCASSAAMTRSRSASLMQPRFPQAFLDIAKQIEDEQIVVEDLQQLPEFVRENRLWDGLRDHVKLVRVVHYDTKLAVFRLLLDDNTRLVIKGCPPESSERERLQLAAEVTIATSFSLHPLMATVIAASDEPSGMCSVLPYAGVSFEAIMSHPDYYSKLTEQERTNVFRELAAHTMTVHARLLRQGATGNNKGKPFIYRDTKPDNVTFDPSTGQVKLIDFGLAMHLSGLDHKDGFTVGRFTPEMVDPARGFWSFFSPSGRFMSLNKTTDVFLTGQQGLEMIQGLPKELQPCPYDMSDTSAMEVILLAHHKADYPRLIRRLHSSKARSFLLRAMAVDPDQRLTPAAALKHPFLAATAAAVNARVAETLPAHAEQVCCILDHLAPLQGQPGVFLATQQQQEWQHHAAAAVSVATTLAAGMQVLADDIPDGCSCSSTVLDADSSNGRSCEPSLATNVSPKDGYSGGCSDMSSSPVAMAADSASDRDAVGRKQHRLIGGLLRKLTTRSRASLYGNTSGSGSGSSSKASTRSAASGVPAAADTLCDGPVDAVAIIEPTGVSVPGWCGIRWLATDGNSRLMKMLSNKKCK